MSRPPVQPGVLPQPYALQFANSASFVDNVARTRDGRRVNGPAVPLPMTYYVAGELVTNNNSNTNSNAWKERRLMTSGVHSGSGLDFALGEDRELKELTNTATIAVAASSTASSMAMPTHAAYIPVRHMPTSPSASALQPGRPVGMTRELSYPTSHGNAALLGVYANNAGNGRGASEPYTAAGAVGHIGSQATGAPRRANWRSYAGPQAPRASLDTTMGAAMYGLQGSTLVPQQQQQLSSLQDADMPVSRHSRSRPAGLLSPQGSLQLIHHHNNTAQTHSASSHNNQGSGAAAGMTMRGDDGSRLRVANTNTMLPLSACPSFGPPPPPRLPSLSLSLNANNNNNHIAPGSAREHHGLSSRRVNTESSTGRTSCCGPGATQSGRLSPTRTSPRAPTMTARSQSSSRHSAAWLSTVPRHFTLLERQRAWQEVERYEQHLNYPKITLSAEALNNGDSEERRRRLEQRYKQVLYGKDTDGYRKYRLIVPTVGEREFHNPMHPVTPRPENDCSKRAFDKYLNAWRRQLHQWDNCDIANIGPEYKPLGTATLADLGLADRGSATVPALPVSAGGSLASAAVTGGPPPPPQPLMLARPAAFKPLPGQRIMQSIANDALPATTTAGSAREGRHEALASQPPLLTSINTNTSSNNVSEVWATHGGEKSPSFFFHTSRMTPGAGVVTNNNNNGAGHGMALNSARLLSSAAETPSRQDGPVLDFNFFANGTPSRQESPLNYMNSILYQALHNGHVSPTTHTTVGGGGATFEAGGKTSRSCPTGGTMTTTGSGDGPAVEETRTSCGDGCTAGPMVTLLRNEFDLISPFSARASPAGPTQTASSLPTQDERVVGHGGTVNALDAAPLGVAATLETWAQLPAIYYPSAGPHAAPRR